jgi:hypothetical protein
LLEEGTGARSSAAVGVGVAWVVLVGDEEPTRVAGARLNGEVAVVGGRDHDRACGCYLCQRSAEGLFFLALRESLRSFCQTLPKGYEENGSRSESEA